MHNRNNNKMMMKKRKKRRKKKKMKKKMKNNDFNFLLLYIFKNISLLSLLVATKLKLLR